MAYKCGTHRGQVVIFPETLDDYITEDNAVQFIDEYVETLEASGADIVSASESRGVWLRRTWLMHKGTAVRKCLTEKVKLLNLR